MANEITKVELFGVNQDGQQMQYAYSGTSMVLKGSLMALSGTNTSTRYATQSRTKQDPIAGIAAADCSGTDVGGANSLNVTVWTQGIFEATISGTTVANGARLMGNSVTGSHNMLAPASAATSASGTPIILGHMVQQGLPNGRGTFRLNL